MGGEPMSQPLPRWVSDPRVTAWVDHLHFPDLNPRTTADRALSCADVRLVPLDQARPRGPIVLICTRPKDHSGRHHQAANGIVLASWRSQ